MYYRLIADLPGYEPLGFAINPGRWNPRGVPIIYAANTVSLTFLEQLSIRGPKVTQVGWKLITLEVKGEIEMVVLGDLPENWRNRPHPQTTREFGRQWAEEKVNVALKVPSARQPNSIYPQEHNLLINPIHPDFVNVIKVLKTEVVDFEIN